MIGNTYLRLLRSSTVRDVSLGYGRITLFDETEIQTGQAGYSVDAKGRSLAGDADGDWQRSWLVIGHDQSTEDPIFVDLSKPLMSVYTAMHGMDDWQPERIADSAAAFFRSLELVQSVAHGREDPDALELNPLSDDERESVLRQIRGLNPHSDLQFWQLLLGEES
jgi:hypothetical protein